MLACLRQAPSRSWIPTFSGESYLATCRFRTSANDRKGAACTQMESSDVGPQSQKLGASGRDHVARWTLKYHFGAKSWREMTRGLAGVWCAALLDSAAVERQLLLPSARRPGLRSTTAGLPPAPQERAKARVWASSASHRDARVDAVTPPLAG